MEILEKSIPQFKKTVVSAPSEALMIVAKAARLKTVKTLSFLSDEQKKSVDQVLKRKKEELKAGQSLKIQARLLKEPDVYLFALPEDTSAFSLLEFSRNSLKAVLQYTTKSVSLVLMEPNLEAQLADTFGAALAARVFKMPVYGKKAKEQKKFSLKTFELVSSKKNRKAFDYGFETGEGSNLVRELGTMPSNKLTSASYSSIIKKLCQKHGIQMKFHSKSQLKKMGAGAFVAVDQGDPDSAGGIYELSYSPRKAKNKKTVSLVGKGLCYDTGGYDIKTGGNMATMKGDMQGSAVALSSILTAARLKLPLKIKTFLGVTENHVSPKAYKADDVVVALNGTSIEVVNTDAEGRMVLADTLTLSSRGNVDMVIDYATLTGMAVYSIGTKMSAGFTNEKSYHSKIVNAGDDSGERVWTFPLTKDFSKALESPVADTLQCIRGRGCDHIYAAYFLSKFVEKKVPWVHIDLSAAENKGGLAHTDSDFTGFGVRWTLEFLRKKYRA